MGSGLVIISVQFEIFDGEIVEWFVCVSGVGGQNVNKVFIVVELCFDVVNLFLLFELLCVWLLVWCDWCMIGEGVLVIDV